MRAHSHVECCENQKAHAERRRRVPLQAAESPPALKQVVKNLELVVTL